MKIGSKVRVWRTQSLQSFHYCKWCWLQTMLLTKSEMIKEAILQFYCWGGGGDYYLLFACYIYSFMKIMICVMLMCCSSQSSLYWPHVYFTNVYFTICKDAMNEKQKWERSGYKRKRLNFYLHNNAFHIFVPHSKLFVLLNCNRLLYCGSERALRAFTTIIQMFIQLIQHKLILYYGFGLCIMQKLLFYVLVSSIDFAVHSIRMLIYWVTCFQSASINNTTITLYNKIFVQLSVSFQ